MLKDKLLNWLNIFLVVDSFLVLFSFLWLVAAVLGRSAGIPLGIELWFQLWEPVFTPAIGILMLGALVSGLTSWASKRLHSKQAP